MRSADRTARGVEYRGRAEASLELARASDLDRVSEKHERAAAVWAALAEFEERPQPGRPSSTVEDVAKGAAGGLAGEI